MPRGGSGKIENAITQGDFPNNTLQIKGKSRSRRQYLIFDNFPGKPSIGIARNFTRDKNPSLGVTWAPRLRPFFR
jgi:hypothetical protein